MSLIEKLVIGGKYKWKHEDKILVYIGKKNGWHQFTLNGSVWCECLDSDLNLMECVFEVGDKVTVLSSDDKDVFEYKEYSKNLDLHFFESVNNYGHAKIENIRHCTDKEIAQGYRDE